MRFPAGSAGDRSAGFGVNAAGDCRGFIGVASFALDRRGVIWMRVVVDVFVAVGAFEAAVDARVKFVGADADAFAVGVLEGRIAVAGKAVGVRAQGAPWRSQQEH